MSVTYYGENKSNFRSKEPNSATFLWRELLSWNLVSCILELLLFETCILIKFICSIDEERFSVSLLESQDHKVVSSVT